MTGYKTYLIAAAMGLATVAQALGWIDNETWLTIMGRLNGGGIATLRAGVKTEIAKL